MKKYICEFIGTAVLVMFGCGSVLLTRSMMGTDMVAISLAFGLSIVAMAYVIGNISGCHVNPAVSLAMLINGKLKLKDFIFYVLAQVLGAFAGIGLLVLIFSQSAAITQAGGIGEIGLGTNGFGESSALGITMLGALITEIILTFVFVYTILGVTSDEKKSSVAGIVIGLALVLVHLVGLNITGTSVNPARSLAPAAIMAIFGKTEALQQVWVFIVAPFIGATLSGFTYKYLNNENKKAKNKD